MTLAHRVYQAAMTAALHELGADVPPVRIQSDEGYEAAMAILDALHLSLHLAAPCDDPASPLARLVADVQAAMDTLDQEA